MTLKIVINCCSAKPFITMISVYFILSYGSTFISTRYKFRGWEDEIRTTTLNVLFA